MIQKILYKKSKGIKKENRSIKKFLKINKETAKYPNYSSLKKRFLSESNGFELKSLTKSLKPKSKILDIGFGAGLSSIFLTKKGFLVTALEPSFRCCEILEAYLNKFKLKANIINCSAESFINHQKFDYIIFNSSFHHLDKPVKTLKNLKKQLNPKGKIFLINEFCLKFYQNKEKTILKEKTSKNNYGGNEHYYYMKDYLNIIKKAGYTKIKLNIPNFYYYPRLQIIRKLNARNKNSYIFSNRQIILRYIWYIALKRLLYFKTIQTLLINTGLIMPNITIAKNPHK